MTEDASFIVLEAIKGAKKVGDKVQVRSELGPGPCGRSARNMPAWLEQVPLRHRTNHHRSRSQIRGSSSAGVKSHTNCRYAPDPRL